MTNNAVYQLTYSDYRTYLYAALFVLGNIIVPQLCHLIPQGGLIFLPIYFFTLIAAYKYGIVAGLLTAIGSPLVNFAFFEMPPAHVLPILLIKSTALAISASFVAKRAGKVSFIGVALSVIAYQLIGTCFEYPMTGSITAAFQDIMIGYPGILIQMILGYIVLRVIGNK